MTPTNGGKRGLAEVSWKRDGTAEIVWPNNEGNTPLPIQAGTPEALIEDAVKEINSAAESLVREAVEKLERRVLELSAEGYACGRIEEVNGIFTGGCGKHVDREESYRCSDCTASFHRDCLRKHFKDDQDKALREARREALGKASKIYEEAFEKNMVVEDVLERIRSLAQSGGEEG